jgi:tetratricopeptide (TPR) repeat protein
VLDQTDMNRPSSLNCPYCGHEAMPFFRFCVVCGLHLEPIKSCDNCYNFLEPTWVACAWCGHFSGLDSLSLGTNEPISFNLNNFYELRGHNRIGSDSNTNDLTSIPEPTMAIDALLEIEDAVDNSGDSSLADDLNSDDLDHSPRTRVADQISKLFESGNLHRQLGDYEKALRNYTELLELDPKSASSFYARAICYIELSKDKLSLDEKFDDAIKLGLGDFSKSIALDPSYLTAFRKETFYQQLSDRQTGVESYLEQKIAAYKKELKMEQETNRIRPSPSVITPNRISYQSQSRSPLDNNGVSSEETYQSQKENAETVSQHGHLHGILHSPDTMESKTNPTDTLSSALDNSDQRQANALYSRGEISQGLGEAENAIHDYSLAISLNPVFSAAFYARAICQVTLEKDELALEDFASAIKLNSDYLSLLRKEPFYVNIGVRRGEVEDYISQRNNAITEPLSPLSSMKISQSTNNNGIESETEKSTHLIIESTGVLGWVTGLTRKLYRKKR